MKHFRSTTLDKIIVMGRKTYESIGRLLPKRTNVIITNNTEYKVEGAIIFNSIEKFAEEYKNKDVYVIGGKNIYEQFLKYADKLIISKINSEYDCDTFINIDYSNFKLENKKDYELFSVEEYIRN
jgi:dihydrofolate reductase